MTQADFGFVGLGVMGHALAQNMERHGYLTAGFDLDPAKVAAFQAHNAAKNAPAFTDPQKFVAALKRPRLVMLMVPAGRPVDAAIQTFRPLLETGDLIIDGGNSHFLDTERRQKELESGRILFYRRGRQRRRTGRALGPVAHAGGKSEAWDLIASYYKAIAAHVDGQACVTHIGPGGSGHYVKMVHNGIEYAEMQLIAEAYDLLHRGLGLSNAQLHRIFSEWNKGELESFLIEIAADIFTRMDPETGKAIVDLILDEAQQKGTGKWTSQNALDVGASIPTINTAVDARLLSALKDQRVDASHLLKAPQSKDRSGSRAVYRLAGRRALRRQDLRLRPGFCLDADGKR
ncbi:MAG: NAD(P)-binding domain-containing protein [Anaerolineales bacterium]|nr:NAD(P)-binding domain-containing protein [Anaerolineales bacterium]